MEQSTRRILNKSQTKIDTLKDITKKDNSRKYNVPFILDELDGVNFSGNTVKTSGTPTVDELESCVSVLSGKINLIIRALKEENILR